MRTMDRVTDRARQERDYFVATKRRGKVGGRRERRGEVAGRPSVPKTLLWPDEAKRKAAAREETRNGRSTYLPGGMERAGWASAPPPRPTDRLSLLPWQKGGERRAFAPPQRTLSGLLLGLRLR